VKTALLVLMPLVVHDLGWNASNYAVLLFVSSLAAVAAVATQPTIEKATGPFKPAIACCGVVGLCSFFTFSGVVGPSTLSTLLFGGLVTLLTAAIAFVEPCIKSLAPLYLPKHWQGRSFGLLASMSGAGALVANLGGTALFQAYDSPTIPGV